MFCLQGVPDVPREPPDEAGLHAQCSPGCGLVSAPGPRPVHLWRLALKFNLLSSARYCTRCQQQSKEQDQVLARVWLVFDGLFICLRSSKRTPCWSLARCYTAPSILLRKKRRSPSPCAWRPDFPGAAREAPCCVCVLSRSVMTNSSRPHGL